MANRVKLVPTIGAEIPNHDFTVLVGADAAQSAVITALTPGVTADPYSAWNGHSRTGQSSPPVGLVTVAGITRSPSGNIVLLPAAVHIASLHTL